MEQLGGDGIDAEGADGVGNLLSIFWSGCVCHGTSHGGGVVWLNELTIATLWANDIGDPTYAKGDGRGATSDAFHKCLPKRLVS